ncbi:hypothetical protein B5F79_10115 [Olsenella sp. An285]|nr:hypothetical protein B5F79_10115 [Olsenella sp. An285]
MVRTRSTPSYRQVKSPPENSSQLRARQASARRRQYMKQDSAGMPTPKQMKRCMMRLTAPVRA